MITRDTVGQRLKSLMAQRNLKQVDILRLAAPYFDNKTKVSKTDLSQYINGRSEPRSDKLDILARALNVSQAWLLGYGDAEKPTPYQTTYTNSTKPVFSKHQLEWIDIGIDKNGYVPKELKLIFKSVAEGYLDTHINDKDKK